MATLLGRAGSAIKEGLYNRFYRKDPSYGGQYPTKLGPKNIVIPDGRYANYLDYIKVDYERRMAYRDYEAMDTDVISTALDLFADDATQYDLDSSESFYVNCSEQEAKSLLEELYFSTLEIDEHIWSIVRTFAKYGDYFVRPIAVDGEGIKYLDYSIHPSRVARIDYKGKIQKFIVDGIVEKNPWDFVHFRLPGAPPFGRIDEQMDGSASNVDDALNANTYGRSAIDSARKPWKQLQLLEDSLILSRLSRAIKRNVFKVNTTGLGETKAWELIDHISDLLKGARTVNPGVGMNVTSNLLRPEEDIVLPVNGEKGNIDVQELGGDVEIAHIADVEYQNNKLCAALKTPKAYLGFEESLNGRNTLRMLDVRYARSIKNMQRVLILGLERLGRIHLASLGKDPFATDFSISLPYISTIEEAEKAEIMSDKLDAVQKVLSTISDLDPDKKLINTKALISYVVSQLGLPQNVEEDLLSKNLDL